MQSTLLSFIASAAGEATRADAADDDDKLRLYGINN